MSIARLAVFSLPLVASVLCTAAHAFIYNTGDDSAPVGMTGGLRWYVVTRMVGGVDRSLAGGISWNVGGGSLAAFKSQFVWAGAVPTDQQLQNTIEQAFSFWTSVDPNPLLNVIGSSATESVAGLN